MLFVGARASRGLLRQLPRAAVRVVPRRVVQWCSRRRISFGPKPDDGFPLVEGSRSHKIHQWCRAHIDQGALLHASKVFVLISAFTLDWTVLRTVLILSSSFSVMFHFLFPVPRPPRMMWGIIFACGHAYSLHLYLREHADYELDEEDNKTYEDIFKKAHFTKWHFMQMMEKGTYRKVKAGEIIFKENDVVDTVHFLLRGTLVEWTVRRPEQCQGMSSWEFKQKHPQAWEEIEAVTSGTAVGPRCADDMYDRHYYDEDVEAQMIEMFGDKHHRYTVSCVALDDGVVLEFPKRWLWELFNDSAEMQAAAGDMQVKDLWELRRSLVRHLQLEKQRHAEDLANLPKLLPKMTDFDKIDKNHDGQIDREEFQAYVDQAPKTSFELMHHSHDGKLDKDEFLIEALGRLLAYVEKHHTRIKHMFEEFDLDKDGHLDAVEFGKALRSIEYPAKILLDSIDENHDGYIDYIEIVHVLKRTLVKIQAREAAEDELTKKPKWAPKVIRPSVLTEDSDAQHKAPGEH